MLRECQFLSTKLDNELFSCLIVEYQESDNQKHIFHSALKVAESSVRVDNASN